MSEYMGAIAIKEMRQNFFFSATHNFFRNPPQIVRGKNQYLYDSEDKVYIDFFAGVSVMNCGHCNSDIIAKTIKQLETLQHTTTIYLTQHNVQLAERLAEILPGDICRTFFCCTGSEANEGAMLLARLHTKRKKFIALEGGLHGRTYLTTAATGIPMWRTDDFLDDCVHFIKRPHADNLDIEQAAQRSIVELKSVLDRDGDNIAAMIVEPIQGNGGIITPVKWYFQEVKSLLKQYGVLLIVDEVQTGYARTGKMFAIEHYDVVPDIIVTAKALGNGVPISTFSTNDLIGASFNKPSASTLGGNPVSSVTAIAVLDFIAENDLIKRSSQLGILLRNQLEKIAARYDFTIEVRGKGLMQGMQIAREYKGLTGAAIVDDIIEAMKDYGFLIGKNGLHRDVLAFQPPLIITENNILEMTKCLAEVLEKQSTVNG